MKIKSFFLVISFSFLSFLLGYFIRSEGSPLTHRESLVNEGKRATGHNRSAQSDSEVDVLKKENETLKRQLRQLQHRLSGYARDFPATLASLKNAQDLDAIASAPLSRTIKLSGGVIDILKLEDREVVELERILTKTKNEITELELKNLEIERIDENTVKAKVTSFIEDGEQIKNVLREELTGSIGRERGEFLYGQLRDYLRSSQAVSYEIELKKESEDSAIITKDFKGENWHIRKGIPLKLKDSENKNLLINRLINELE